MEISVQSPLTKEAASKLKAGDRCLISGVVYTARDAAHKRLCELIEEGKELPFDLTNAIIYFVGPTPAKPGQIIGSAGPTTSYRMDAYSPTLIELGISGMIGKGDRNEKVVNVMKKYGAVYFGAIGGCGALIGDCIKKAEVVAFADLGTEAVFRLQVENFPVLVVIDVNGNNLYKTGREEYLKSVK